MFDIYISSDCKLWLSLSPDSSRCIPCLKFWHGNLIGITIATIVGGLALVIVIFVFNMTIAVGTLNGIPTLTSLERMQILLFHLLILSQYLYLGSILMLALTFACLKAWISMTRSRYNLFFLFTLYF